MDFLPDQQVVEVSKELPKFSLDDEGDEHGQWSPTGIQQCKALLFEILSKHYGQSSFQPLLPSGLNDVCIQITELLGKLGLQNTITMNSEEVMSELFLWLSPLFANCYYRW